MQFPLSLFFNKLNGVIFLIVLQIIVVGGCESLPKYDEYAVGKTSVNSKNISGSNFDLTAATVQNDETTKTIKTHPRGGTYYDDCYDAAKALGNIKTETDKVGVIPSDLVRCNVAPYVFEVNKHGLLEPVYSKNSKSESSLKTVKDGLRQYLCTDIQRKECSTEHSEKKVLIYIHGGLSKPENAISRAEELAPWMIQDGYYPIFLVWDSSLLSTYLDYAFFTTDGVRNSPLTRWSGLGEIHSVGFNDGKFNNDGAIKRWTLGATRFIGDLGSGVFKAPENYVVQIDNYLERRGMDPESPYRINPDKFLSNCKAAPSEKTGRKCLDSSQDESKIFIFPELTNGVIKKSDINLKSSFFSSSELKFHPLILARVVTTMGSEFGRNSWDNMIRRTRLSMTRSQHLSEEIRTAPNLGERMIAQVAWFDLNDQQYDAENCERDQKTVNDVGGFALAMDLIHCELSKTERKNVESSPTVTLVGHSMGAIIADEILWAFPNTNYDKIIYMGSATSVRDFKRITKPVINDNPRKPKFYNLMLHPYAKATSHVYGGMVPQGTLLEWIDEMFEGPRNLQDKRIGKYRNAVRFDGEYGDNQNQLKFRVFPVQRILKSPNCDKYLFKYTKKIQRCHPISHGEFDQFTFWREAFYEGSSRANQ